MSVAPYVTLYGLSAMISAALALYGVRRRQYVEARPFALMMAGLAFWSACHALSVGSTQLEDVQLWAQLQYLGVVAVGPLWLFFALAHANRWERATPELRVALAIPAALAYVMEAGHLSVDLYPVALAVVVASVAGAMQPQIYERRLDLRLDLPDNLPLVWANSARLEQVLTNLLANAIKFTLSPWP